MPLFDLPHAPSREAAAWPGGEGLQEGSNTCHHLFSGSGLLHLVTAPEAVTCFKCGEGGSFLPCGHPEDTWPVAAVPLGMNRRVFLAQRLVPRLEDVKHKQCLGQEGTSELLPSATTRPRRRHCGKPRVSLCSASVPLHLQPHLFPFQR